ncbi:MAG: iron-containing alcohol dehydrogenase [Solirubrobacterales bacterium]
MLPGYYQYYNPVKIISGKMALENIPHELVMMGCKRPLIITDKGIVQAGLIKICLDAWGDSEMVIGALYDDTPLDSSNHVVNEVAAIYKQKKCDCIIAVGGGSVLDTAKGVNIVISEGTDDLLKFMGADRLTAKMQPMICIPTTSGTGSEVTLVAVIANVDKNVKMLFVSYKLLPEIAVLDPRMTFTVPPKITAMTGMDALTHAVEAYSCLQKNPLSDAYAMKAIDLCRLYLEPAVKNGKDEEARMGMANASLLAGCAFSNSMVGMVHQVGHAAGAVAHIPHGLAMAILLPVGMEFNLEPCGQYYGELLLALAGPEEYAKTPADKRALRSIEVVKQMNANLKKLSGMPNKLSEAGVPREKLPDIAKTALGDAAQFQNPREAFYEDILEFLKAAY